MDVINWDVMEEALINKSLPKEELIKEIVKLRKLRSDVVDFCGWLMDETRYCKYNSELKDSFMIELDKRIDVIFYNITKK